MPILDILQQLADEPAVEPVRAAPEPIDLLPDLPPVEPVDAAHALTMRNFISQLFSARDRAHQLHLRTRSFAKHVALGELYDGLIELADKLAEVTQGAYGIMEPVMGNVASMSAEGVTDDEAVKHLMDALVQACAAGHSAVAPADTFLHSLIDEVQALVFRSKYKLDNLS